MKKNGWGLRVELAFLLLFVICIIIATVGLYRMGLFGNEEGSYIDIGEYTKGNGTYDYDELELKVSNAARKYYNDRYQDGYSDTLIVSVDSLINNGYLSPIYDGRDKECKGYAKILPSKNIVSYIRCSIYQTTGYSEDYE